MEKRTVIIVVAVFMFSFVAKAQFALDTSLFTISLVNNSKSLFGCNEIGKVRKTLSGPVVMADNKLLFCSENGYVLYNLKGAIVDSHSVFKMNKGLSEDDPKRIMVAFPSDKSTILYYRKTNVKDKPIEIYAKKISKNRLKSIKEKQYKYYSKIANKHVFNIAHNSITDDMASTYFALPQLIGFSSLEMGNKWWTIDKFYTFSSPMIYANNERYNSFFPGIRGEKKFQFVNPLQVFKWGDNWYYSGIYSKVGTVEKKYYQTFYVFDPAGNVLYADTLLKQKNRDVIIGEDEETYYTVKKMESLVFQPAVDKVGNIYYSIINYKNKDIEVRKRCYYTFKPVSGEPLLAHLIDVERSIKFEPVSISCNMKQPVGKTIPNVTLINNKGKRIKSKARHITRDEYIARIWRTAYRDIDKKLVRKQKKLPKNIQQMKDSLSNMSTASCPYVISLSGPKGMIRSFGYPPGEDVICARVIALRESGEVLVRVDCENFAEILIFKSDGEFVNRFVFNKQNYKNRKDIIVASKRSPIVELDFESEPGKEKFLYWERKVLN